MQIAAARLGWLGLVLALALSFAWTSMAEAAASKRSVVPQLTVTAASQVFGSIWPKFDSAFFDGEWPEIARYSTNNAFDAAASETGCGCAWRTPHSKVLFTVPVQHSYPISFLAQISTPAPRHSFYSPFTTLVVFTKERAHGHWLVAYLVRYAGGKGYLTRSVVRAAPKATFPIAEVSPQITQFFTAVVTTGTPPADDSWPETGSTGQELADYLSVAEGVKSLGDQQQTTFVTVEHSVAFAYPDGDIMCANYLSDSEVTTPPDHPAVQPSDQSTWGALLAPGEYSSLTKMGMHSFCYSVNTKASRVRDDVSPISFFGSVYQIDGIPAIPSGANTTPVLPPIISSVPNATTAGLSISRR